MSLGGVCSFKFEKKNERWRDNSGYFFLRSKACPLHTHKEFIISLQVYLFTGNLIVLKHERRLDFLDSLKLCYFVYLQFAFWNKNKLNSDLLVMIVGAF